MRIVQLFVLALLLFGCRTKTDELLGHWHSVPLEDGYFWTLDITDSTTQVNKYDLDNSEREVTRFDKNGIEGMDFMWKEYRNLEVKDDTLFLDELFSFVRVVEKNHLNDYFLGSLVQLNLKNATTNSIKTLPFRKSQLVNLYVGPPRDAFESNCILNSDSTCFQTLDVLAGYSDLERFAQRQKDKLNQDINYWLVIHADSSTSLTTIDSTRMILEPLGVINGFYVSHYNYELDRLEYEELNRR